MHFPLKKNSCTFFINQILRISVKFLQFLSRLQCNSVFFHKKMRVTDFLFMFLLVFARRIRSSQFLNFKVFFYRFFFYSFTLDSQHTFYVFMIDTSISFVFSIYSFLISLFCRQHQGKNKCFFTGLNIKIHRKAKENEAEKNILKKER